MTARSVRRLGASVLLLALAACARPEPGAVDRAARALGELAPGAGIDESQLRDLLAAALAVDEYRCLPEPARVLAAPRGSAPERRIEGVVPHYGLYHGPMSYRVGAWGGMWRVSLHIAVDVEPSGDMMELPDCALGSDLEGPVTCQGTPYDQAPGVEACPGSGRFEAVASRHNLRALLQRWSHDAEEYFNRDARHFGLPVRYQLRLFLADDGPRVAEPIDVRLPLWLSCGRTPYFLALRSGWSMPVLAHELGHYLGLLDEYQALSGIFPFYPKTPFAGSEDSRMGLSMKRHTRVWPLHHYLILRRYHCPAPERLDPYSAPL